MGLWSFSLWLLLAFEVFEQVVSVELVGGIAEVAAGTYKKFEICSKQC